MNIAVDLGNTHAKAAVFEGCEMSGHYDKIKIEGLAGLLNGLKPENVVLGSVNQDPSFLHEQLDDQINLLIVSHETPLPIQLGYNTPATLGVDRIASAVGAFIQSPNTNSLVIDIGTCITYEFIDAMNIYQGGGIAPGLNMKYKALSKFTANLPSVSGIINTGLVGKTTEESIKSGVINGTIAEIREIIRMYCDKFAPLRIIMCGGDAKFFNSQMNTPVFVTPELVLVGLNGILQHNVL